MMVTWVFLSRSLSGTNFIFIPCPTPTSAQPPRALPLYWCYQVKERVDSGDPKHGPPSILASLIETYAKFRPPEN